MDTLGKRVAHARQVKEMTLRTLAIEAGVSAAFLSQVEHDQVVPSLASLQSIAQVLGVPSSYIVESLPEKSPIVRHNERMKLSLPGSDIAREVLTPGFNHALQVFQVTLAPGEVSRKDFRSHPSEEFILVLNGELRVELGDEKHSLEAGDTILYNAMLPHRNFCGGDKSVSYIVINTPPAV